MSLPTISVRVADNSDGSFDFTINSMTDSIQKNQVNTIGVSGESVLITMSGGKVYAIWDWTTETNLGATSADDLRDKINTIVITIP